MHGLPGGKHSFHSFTEFDQAVTGEAVVEVNMAKGSTTALASSLVVSGVSFSVDLNLTPRLSPATSVSFGVQLTNPYMRLMKRVLKVRSFDSHQVGNNISAYLRQQCIFLRVCHILH